MLSRCCLSHVETVTYFEDCVTMSMLSGLQHVHQFVLSCLFSRVEFPILKRSGFGSCQHQPSRVWQGLFCLPNLFL